MKRIMFLVLALLLLTSSAFALTYRWDTADGEWNDYNSAITDSGYFLDLDNDQSLFNRDMETSFNLDASETGCEANWCKPTGFGTDGIVERSNLEAHEGTYSMRVRDNGGHVKVLAQTEIVGDTNVIFWAKGAGAGDASYGYIDDANNFHSAGSVGNYADWTLVSFVVPEGKYKIYLYWNTINGAGNIYFDDIQIKRTNTGTFRQNNEPNYCSTINSCSNINYHLPATNAGKLYYVVDWLAGGTSACYYRLNKGLSAMATSGGAFNADGLMTQGTNGMFYVDISSEVDANHYKDLSVEAYCIKAPLAKKFYAQPRIYRYGNINGGNLETTITDFNSYSDGTITRASNEAQDGAYSLKAVVGAGHIRIKNTSFNVGGTSVSFFARGTFASDTAYGYVNSADAFTSKGTFGGASYADWNYFTFDVPAGTFYFALNQNGNVGENYYIDNVMSSGAKQENLFTATNTLTSNYGLRGTEYTFTNTYKTLGGTSITGANCSLKVGNTFYPMTYSSGAYSVNYTFTSDGSFSIMHGCAHSSYNDGNSSYTAQIITPASQIITFTPIENISSYALSDFSQEVNFVVGNYSNDIIFSVVAQEAGYAPVFVWNDSTNSLQQYDVYVSTDGTNWAYSEAITFGQSTNYDDPVQKIWNDNYFKFSFSNALESGVIKYFKVARITPPSAWRVIKGSGDWINVNEPTQYLDLNGHAWDLFHDSNYSNIVSYSYKQFSEMTSSDFNAGYELQFTAYASASTTLKVGYRVGSTDSTNDVNISTEPTRYSVPINTNNWEARLLIKSTATASNRIYITDYALVPRAYFASRLELFNRDGSTLNAVKQTYDSTSQEYIREGLPFRFKLGAYDREGTLKTLRIEAQLGGITIKTYDFDISAGTHAGKSITWDSELEAVIDLNGYAQYGYPFRDFTAKATLIDANGREVAETFKSVKLLQYPYFADDISLDAFSLINKLGANPRLRINLIQQAPEQFIGLKIIIYDINSSYTTPAYSKTILQQELACGIVCQKDLLLNDFAWELATRYKIDFLILLKTENEHYANELTYKHYVVNVSERDFDTARIFQVFERTDNTYRADELIPLVLQLRDSPIRDIKGEISVYLTADVCTGASGANCTLGTTKFYPQKYIYDETTGYAYFYWNTIFYKDDGSLMPDGNYLRFWTHMSDITGGRSGAKMYNATHANKCQTAYGSLFLNGSFNMNIWEDLLSVAERALYGCTDYTDGVVEINDAQEERLLIDEDHATTAGQNHSLFCLNTDTNNNYTNGLGQELLCGILYKRSEQSIDQFKIYLGNEYSDYSKDNDEKQYIDFEISAEDVIFNDPVLLMKALQAEYQTDSINTLGEIVFKGADRLFSGVANPLTDLLEGATKSGLITNIGFDMNWDKSLDPNYISGIFFFKIEGINVINQYDYIEAYPVLETQSPKYFRTWANNNKVSVLPRDTIVRVYASDLETINSFKVSSPLVIYAKPSTASVSVQSTDTNKATAGVLPTTLKFNLIADMLSNSESSNARIFLPLVFSYIVPPAPFNAMNFVAGLGKALTDPVGFLMKNWFFFLMGFLLIMGISLIIRNVRSGGGGSQQVSIYNGGR